MPLPVPNLDDRRFDDLVEEAGARLAAHLPELTRIAPGDPVHSLIDLFAWYTETILYRANLIPERQRRVFLNLLQIPVRPARPARGVVCVDAGPTSVSLPPLLKEGSQFRGGKQALTGLGELQPTCLSLQVLSKRILTIDDLEALNLTLQDLHEQYGLRRGQTPQPFQPRRFEIGREVLNLERSLDQSLYLACIAPKQLDSHLDLLRENLAGIRLNIALAPADELEAERVSDLESRTLLWELVAAGPDGEPRFLPLEVMADTSLGGRQTGVVRLRLPKNASLFADFANADPMFDGSKQYPPALEDAVEASRVALWIRLRCPDEPGLALGYLGLNGVEVVAQGLRRDTVVGLGTGLPDQVVALPDQQIDGATLQLQVEEEGAWVDWQGVDFLAGQGPSARVYRLNADAGYVYFGDGLEQGRRPPRGARIRIAEYRYGGGIAGNLPAGDIKEIVDASPRFKLRHEWPLQGGRDGETVAQAEQRIPQFLTHRNRAVTATDFQVLCRNNPLNPVARAEVMPGFLPGATLAAAQEEIPGVVSVFVLPPAEVGIGNWPKPTRGLLKDVFQYLLQRIQVGTELYVLSPQFLPLAVSVVVQVRDPQTEQETLNAVRAVITEYLWPLTGGGADGTGWPLAQPVQANELLTQAARVAGVRAVNGVALFRHNDAGWQRLPEAEAFSLAAYQLPELMGVRVAVGGPEDTPQLPQGIGPLQGAAKDSGDGIPVPVIPEVC
ncbi:MAG: putative baseplate assembly protein [Pseudomonadota bacterium]|nr:putative baseplate assembly protein [Pseudomonadota bacterium]